jgi:flagellin
MVMSVNTNVLSLTAQRNMVGTQNSLSTSIERLSTGLRINSAKDDAAGLAIGERFTSSIRGTAVAQRNANDGISFAQTAEGALDVIGSNLQRIRELAVQSLNDSNTDADRAAIDQEVKALKAEVDRIAKETTFNGRNILDGSLGTMKFQIGAERGQTLDITGKNARADQLGATTLSTSTTEGLSFTGALSINGENIDLGPITDMPGVADAINATFSDGSVKAEVGVTTVNIGSTAAGTADIGPAGGITLTGNTDDDVTEINSRMIALGSDIRATKDGTDIILTSESGASIGVEESAAGVLTGGDLSADVTGGETFDAGITITAQGDTLNISGAGATALGIDGATTRLDVASTTVATRDGANNALDAMDAAIDQITSMRADLGAIQNRFENVIEVAGVQGENLSAARSRIQDADFAAETANLTRAQILQQAGLASLAQANSSPQAVLSLLG